MILAETCSATTVMPYVAQKHDSGSSPSPPESKPQDVKRRSERSGSRSSGQQTLGHVSEVIVATKDSERAIARRRFERLRSLERNRSDFIPNCSAQDLRCVDNLFAPPSDLHVFVFQHQFDYVVEKETAWGCTVCPEQFGKLLRWLLLDVLHAST